MNIRFGGNDAWTIDILVKKQTCDDDDEQLLRRVRQGGGGASLKICKSCMLSNIATPNANTSIGRSIRNSANNMLPSCAMRLSSRTRRPRRTVPFCFLPMPVKLICCMTHPPATISSVPIHNYAMSNERLATEPMEKYYSWEDYL